MGKKLKIQKKISTRRLFKNLQGMYPFQKQKNKLFYVFLGLTIVLCAFLHPYQEIAMWLAFFLAGYSAIANDSIQTIGTFISSNSRRVRWYYLWIFMGSIFIATILYSWLQYGGDISHERLHNKGLDTPPSKFTFFQLFAPIILLILTRLRMPVSTSILLLSAFSTHASTLGKIMVKSLFGYLIAFVLSFVLWSAITFLMRKISLKRRASVWWYPIQWLTSGALWSVWIMQDMANIAVVLPRSLSLEQFLVVTSYIFFGLGLLFYLKGDRIQEIVEEKTSMIDVRVATLIDISYACILYYLKIVNKIPISTTWVFIGLLGGRELGLGLMMYKKKRQKSRLKYGLRIIFKDVLYTMIGLFVSILLAIAINQKMQDAILKLFGF